MDPSASDAATPAADDAMTALLFPFADETVVGGIQRGYLRFFRGSRRVLDVGAGRGIFLRLLREAGVEGVGVDSSAATAAAVAAEGFRVIVGDAATVAAKLAASGERFDGVFCSHLVEHLQPTAAIDLVCSLARLLAPGGRLVLVTPNPRCPEVIGHSFWLDPTHVRPYPRELIERIGVGAGLSVEASFDDPATRNLGGVVRRTRRWLTALLTGADPRPPMDSVVVLRRA
jgi:O-antigen chain-terminating methyltransferase